MTTAEDAELVRACAAGRPSAFEELLARYERPVYNVALRIVGDPEDARDVAQTVFLRVWEHLDSFDPRQRFFSWLYRIAVNEALDAAARRRRDPAQSERPPVEPVAPGAPADDDLRETAAALRRAIARLPAEARAVIVLRHYLDCSYKEMSEILDIPEKTVKSRLFSARERLRVALSTAGFLRADGR